MFIDLWWENLRDEDHFEDPSVDGRIILKCIFEKWAGGALLHSQQPATYPYPESDRSSL
jgi:hypothetical protein